MEKRNNFIFHKSPPESSFEAAMFLSTQKHINKQAYPRAPSIRNDSLQSQNNGFLKAAKEFEKFTDVFDRVKNLQISSWKLHAAPLIVFRRLSSKDIESFNLLIKIKGVLFCCPAKMIPHFLRWSDKLVEKNLEYAWDAISRRRIVIEKTGKKLGGAFGRSLDWTWLKVRFGTMKRMLTVRFLLKKVGRLFKTN